MSGRWPANVILSPEMADVLDGQSGNLQATGRTVKRELSKKAGAFDGIFTGSYKAGDEIGYSDSGGASRYFLTAGYEPWEVEWILANGLRPCGMEEA